MLGRLTTFGPADTTRREKRRPQARLWLIIAAVAFAVSLISALVEVRQRQIMQDTSLGQFTHNLFQTYDAQTKFLDELHTFVFDRPVDMSSIDEVQLEFDLLYSRLPLFTDGAAGRWLSIDPEGRRLVADLSAALARTDELLPKLSRDFESPEFREIEEAMEPIRPRLFDLARKHLIMLESRSDALRSFEGGFGFLLAPVLTGGLLLILFALQLFRSLKLEADLAEETLQREVAGEQLAHQAGHDPLTGLPNRTRLVELLGQNIARAGETSTPMALLLLDLARFKPINESFGHEVGDEVLRIVAARIRGSMRETDTVARMESDTFAIVLAGLDEAAQAEVAERLLETLRDPIAIDDHKLFIGGSIGISQYPRDGEDAEQLIFNADAALQGAKRDGRDRVVFYASGMNADVAEKLNLESRLRQALAGEELALHYQPQVTLSDGRVTGVEALLRWRDPEHGFIPPSEFIPAAEASGLIVQIDDWVLRTACKQAAQWRREGLMPLSMAVNVSAQRFQVPGFADSVEAVLAETGLQPEYLELELTESVLLRDVDTATEAMNRLSALGVRLAIDDFGTGYSSLAYVQRFPVSRLKIDRDFVHQTHLQRGAGAIARSVIALGKSLDVDVLGEGIETDAEWDFLKLHGCNTGQGYLFSRPLSAEALGALLRSPAARHGWLGLPVNIAKTEIDPIKPDRTASYPVNGAVRVCSG